MKICQWGILDDSFRILSYPWDSFKTLYKTVQVNNTAYITYVNTYGTLIYRAQFIIHNCLLL